MGKIEISVNVSRNVSVDYENDLNRLDEIRRRIREILGNRTTYPKHVQEIQNRITKSEEKVRQLMEKEMKTGESVDASEAKTKEANKEIKKLRKFLQRLNVLIDEYRRNLTRSIDEIPTASIIESRKYLNISSTAVDISNNVRKTVEKSEKIRTEIEDKLPDYKNKKSRISKKLENYLLEFGTLDELVVRINTLVCGSPNDGCGGCDSDGCGQCGDSDNCDGATTLAEKALATAKKAENALREKERRLLLLCYLSVVVLSVCFSVRLFVCVCLFVCYFVCLFVCLFICLFVCVCLFVTLFVCLFICLCVSVCLFVCLFVCMYVYLSVYLSIYSVLL